MCNNVNCPMHGGACGMKTMDGKSNLMVCADYVDDTLETSVFTLTRVIVNKNGALVTHTDTYPTESAAVQNMMKDYYGQRANASSPTDCYANRHSAQLTEANGVIHVWKIDQATVELKHPQPEVRNGEIRVATPIGTLVARDQGNPDYPGIMVDLECNYDGEPEVIGIANIEWGVCDDGQSRRICASLFRDMTVDDCSDYLAYKGGEESLSHDVPGVLIGVMQDDVVQETECKVDVNSCVIHSIVDSRVCNASKAYVLINGARYPAYAREALESHGQNGLEFVYDK